MYFKQLAIGDTFDFIRTGLEAMTTSFYARCTKVSARCYTWLGNDGRLLKSQVGSVYAQVYHVEKALERTNDGSAYSHHTPR